MHWYRSVLMNSTISTSTVTSKISNSTSDLAAAIMQDPSNIYVFGDQTLDVLKNLQGLLLSESALVTEFLDGSFRILRREISQLPSSKKQEFPLPETLGLLLEAAQDRKRRHPALDSAFVIIYEIAYYVQ